MPKKSSFKRRGGVSGKKVREQEQGQLKMAIRTRTVFARSVCVCVRMWDLGREHSGGGATHEDDSHYCHFWP